jgi:hypothetical protein
MKLTEEKNLSVSLNWTTVVCSDDKGWFFGEGRTIDSELRKAISGPRVYRFRFLPANPGLESLYIGESERFQDRCDRYRRASSKLSRRSNVSAASNKNDDIAYWKELRRDPCARVAVAIRRAESSHDRVELQLLGFDDFVLNGSLISVTTSLDNPFTRRMVENLAILSSDRIGVLIMNRGVSLMAKEFKRRIRSLNATRSKRQNGRYLGCYWIPFEESAPVPGFEVHGSSDARRTKEWKG